MLLMPLESRRLPFIVTQSKHFLEEKLYETAVPAQQVLIKYSGLILLLIPQYVRNSCNNQTNKNNATVAKTMLITSTSNKVTFKSFLTL